MFVQLCLHVVKLFAFMQKWKVEDHLNYWFWILTERFLRPLAVSLKSTNLNWQFPRMAAMVFPSKAPASLGQLI